MRPAWAQLLLLLGLLQRPVDAWIAKRMLNRGKTQSSQCDTNNYRRAKTYEECYDAVRQLHGKAAAENVQAGGVGSGFTSGCQEYEFGGSTVYMFQLGDAEIADHPFQQKNLCFYKEADLKNVCSSGVFKLKSRTHGTCWGSTQHSEPTSAGSATHKLRLVDCASSEAYSLRYDYYEYFRGGFFSINERTNDRTAEFPLLFAGTTPSAPLTSKGASLYLANLTDPSVRTNLGYDNPDEGERIRPEYLYQVTPTGEGGYFVQAATSDSGLRGGDPSRHMFNCLQSQDSTEVEWAPNGGCFVRGSENGGSTTWAPGAVLNTGQKWQAYDIECVGVPPAVPPIDTSTDCVDVSTGVDSSHDSRVTQAWQKLSSTPSGYRHIHDGGCVFKPNGVWPTYTSWPVADRDTGCSFGDEIVNLYDNSATAFEWELKFTLTTQQATCAKLTGAKGTADNKGWISVNGVEQGFNSDVYNDFSVVRSLPEFGHGSFVAGTNTIKLRITNNVNSAWGVRVVGCVDVTACDPPPSPPPPSPSPPPPSPSPPPPSPPPPAIDCTDEVIYLDLTRGCDATNPAAIQPGNTASTNYPYYNNLKGQTLDPAQPTQMRFRQVAWYQDRWLDLVVERAPESASYDLTGGTGCTNNEGFGFFQNAATGDSLVLDFSLRESDPAQFSTKVTVPNFYMSFYDLDGSSTVRNGWTFITYDGVGIAPDQYHSATTGASVDADYSDSAMHWFVSTDTAGVTDPIGPTTMTAQQEGYSATFRFKDSSGFRMAFGGSATGSTDTQADRNFIFAGASSLVPICPPPPSPPPAPPTPPPVPPPVECPSGAEVCVDYDFKTDAENDCAVVQSGETCHVRYNANYYVMKSRDYPTCEAAGYQTITSQDECQEIGARQLVADVVDWSGSGGESLWPIGCTIYDSFSSPSHNLHMDTVFSTGWTDPVYQWTCMDAKSFESTRNAKCICRDPSVYAAGAKPWSACTCAAASPPSAPFSPAIPKNDAVGQSGFVTTSSATCATQPAPTVYYALSSELCRSYALSNGYPWGGTSSTGIFPAGCYQQVSWGSVTNVLFNSDWSSSAQCGAAAECVCAAEDISHALPTEAPHVCDDDPARWGDRVDCIGASASTTQAECDALGCCWDVAPWEAAMGPKCYRRWSDVNWKTLLEIEASTNTKIYHRRQPADDGGNLVAGDQVRYLPLISLRPSTGAPANTFDVCTNVDNYPVDFGLNNDYGGTLQTDGNGELFVVVNIPDINTLQEGHAEYVYCYKKTARRRRLQVIGGGSSSDWLRGGGTLSVRYVSAPAPPPPPPQLPGQCDATSHVTQPVGTEIASSSAHCTPNAPAHTLCHSVSEVVGDRLWVSHFTYPRCLAECTKAALDAKPTCASTCNTGWYCCVSLGNTCIRNGGVCPPCPDCATTADPCAGSPFEYPTPSSTRQCCAPYSPPPPSSPSPPPFPPPPALPCTYSACTGFLTLGEAQAHCGDSSATGMPPAQCHATETAPTGATLTLSAAAAAASTPACSLATYTGPEDGYINENHFTDPTENAYRIPGKTVEECAEICCRSAGCLSFEHQPAFGLNYCWLNSADTSTQALTSSTSYGYYQKTSGGTSGAVVTATSAPFWACLCSA